MDTPTPTDEDEASELPTECAVCGATGTLLRLDDGTVYCSAHRGLSTAPDEVVKLAEEFGLPHPITGEPAAVTETETEAEADESDEPPWPLLPPVRMIVALIYDAALATFHEDDTFGDPPTGWAPPPADESPFMEAGAILAVATLIEAAEIDREIIKQLADAFRGGETPTNGDASV